MQIQVVEAFWRIGAAGEYSGRFSAKPYWATFADGWCWENGTADITVALATVDGKKALEEQMRRFASFDGPGILVIGAHGELKNRKRTLHVPTAKGSGAAVTWEDLARAFEGVVNAGEKVVIFDSCAFGGNGTAATKFVKETKIGLLLAFDDGLDVFDSMLFEIAFANYLLFEWHEGDKRTFLHNHLQTKKPLGEAFPKLYKSLAEHTGARLWQSKDDAAVEITTSALGRKL